MFLSVFENFTVGTIQFSRLSTYSICKFDKGNVTVIINTKDYVDKLNTIVSDGSMFREIQIDENDTHHVI